MADTKRNAPKFWSDLFMSVSYFKPMYYRMNGGRINPFGRRRRKLPFVRGTRCGWRRKGVYRGSSFLMTKHSILTPFRSSTMDSTRKKPIFSKRGLDILLASVWRTLEPAAVAASSRRL